MMMLISTSCVMLVLMLVLMLTVAVVRIEWKGKRGNMKAITPQSIHC